MKLLENDYVEIREEVIDKGPEKQIEPPTKDEAWEIIRTLKYTKSPGEDSISAEIFKCGDKKYGKIFTH
jgi:hypothetical protein